MATAIDFDFKEKYSYSSDLRAVDSFLFVGIPMCIEGYSLSPLSVLADKSSLAKCMNGGYLIRWECSLPLL